MKKDNPSRISPSCLHGTQLLVTNSLSGSTKRSNETVEFEGETLPIDPCGNFIRLTPISTLDVKSSLKQMDAWIVSTKIRSQ